MLIQSLPNPIQFITLEHLDYDSLVELCFTNKQNFAHFCLNPLFSDFLARKKKERDDMEKSLFWKVISILQTSDLEKQKDVLRNLPPKILSRFANTFIVLFNTLSDKIIEAEESGTLEYHIDINNNPIWPKSDEEFDGLISYIISLGKTQVDSVISEADNVVAYARVNPKLWLEKENFITQAIDEIVEERMI